MVNFKLEHSTGKPPSHTTCSLQICEWSSYANAVNVNVILEPANKSGVNKCSLLTFV